MGAETLPLRTACGFVLFRRGAGGVEYLVLVNQERDEPGLPKGHTEPGEAELETARRETLEETGIADLDVRRGFETRLAYRVDSRGRPHRKEVVYFAASAPPEAEVRLSREHSRFAWLPLAGALETLPHESVKQVVREAALFLKDPAACALAGRGEAEAAAHLRSLPEAHEGLVAHLEGAARLARRFAEALAEAGERVDVEAAAASTLLHDVGRAIGRHENHQGAGVEHLHATPLAAHALGCITHFTKGAGREDLLDAGLGATVVDGWQALQDLRMETWEEHCCALADACMRGDTPTWPEHRFADVRTRYDAAPLVALQEFRTATIRRRMHAALGHDPLGLVDLEG